MDVEGLEVIRLADGGETGIPTQGTGEEDHDLHTVVGGLMIMTHTGGGRNVPGQQAVVATLDRTKSN